MIIDRLGQPVGYGSLLFFPGIGGVYLVADSAVCHTTSGSYCVLRFKIVERPDGLLLTTVFSADVGSCGVEIRYRLGEMLNCEVLR